MDPSNLPYQPRKRGARPDRALPALPRTEHDRPTGEADVEAINAVEADQAYMSPPSPPKAPTRLPPPPPAEDSDEAPNASGPQRSAQHLHPHVSSLPSGSQMPPTTLTPLRAHYLKKTLVNLQMSHELMLVTDPVLGANALGLLGDPFILPEGVKRDALRRVSEIARNEGRLGDLPFMRFLFHQFVLTFPFLTTAPPNFWSGKVQPFLSSFLLSTGYNRQTSLSKEEEAMAESLMSKEERKEAEDKKKLWAKVEKHLALMVGVGIKIVGGEEVVRIGQSELRRLEAIQEERRKKWAENQLPPPPPPSAGDGSAGLDSMARQQHATSQVFDVNILGVRVITEKGRMRHKQHEEFLIRTRRPGVGDTFVSRRYGDFKRLADELRIAFPDNPTPAPPPKDRTTVASPVPAATVSNNYSYYNPLRAIYGNTSPAPIAAPDPNESTETLNTAATSTTTPLSREKNRLTLRAYLQSILSYPYLLNSPIVRSFLLSSPTSLTPAEAIDCRRRLEADAVREEGRKRFREEAERRVEALREGLAQFKGDVLSTEGGVQKVFEVVRRVERVEDLPKAEHSVLEWGRISLAATIFQLFVASDTASETLASLKRLHGLMPYFVLKGILKISNPMAMIRGVLDLFLARPFGGQSLIQRMFSSSLTEDVRLITEDIETVTEKVDDPVLCQKIEQYASAPFEIQEIYRRDAVAENVDLLVIILRSPDPPTLSRPQFQRVYKASRAYKEYKTALAEAEDSDDEGIEPESDDAWLFEDLNILLKLWSRKKEKEQLLALIFEGVTAELLKDIITIFYSPLAQVYKAASIADSLGDLQNFLNDMIRTVEQVEELSQEDPGRTVQTFIDLVQRHEQAFYSFVHNVHSKGQGLFDSLMAWIELFLSYARDGIAQPIDLEFILPHAGSERQNIMAEVDAVAQYHYKLKVAHEEKIRRRFYSAGPGGNNGMPATGQSADEAALMDSVMASLSIDETTVGDVGEIGDEESEGEDEDGEGDYDYDEHSEQSSIRSVPHTPAHPFTTATTPASPLPASLQPEGGDRSRRGSSSSARKSLDKIRSSLDFKRPSPDSDKKHKEEKRPPPIKVPRPSGQNKKKGNRKAKERAAAAELLKAPETPAINELRPLFVEVIRPQLKVKPLKKLPPTEK